MRSHVVIAGLVAAALLGCSEGSVAGATPTPPDTATPTPAGSQSARPERSAAEGGAESKGTPAPTPAPTPVPTPAPVSRASVHEPTGAAPLSRDGETVVDPSASFELELEGRFADVRLVLIDAADAHVPATHTREVDATTRLTLAPTAPLVPGSCHVLRVEGIGARELHDAAGRAYAPSSFDLLVAGTPPPPEPKRRPKRRRR